MAGFLTDAWVSDVIAALNDAGAASGITLRLQQVVTGGPSGDASYWTAFENGTVTGGVGDLPDPDVTITQDYDTAVALARGDLVAQAAFMQGKLKVTGNMGKLLQHQDAIAALGPAMSSVATEYYGRAAPT